MLIRTLVLAITLLSIPALATSALAEPADDDYGRPGFFAGAAMAVGNFTQIDDVYQSFTENKIKVDTEVGVNVRVGYRLMPLLGVEAQYEWLPGPDITETDVGEVLDSSTMMVSANAKLYLIRKELFQPYVLGGVGYLCGDDPEADGRRRGFAARMGAGVDIYATRNIAVAVDVHYILPTGDVEDLDYVSVGVGVQYLF